MNTTLPNRNPPHRAAATAGFFAALTVLRYSGISQTDVTVHPEFFLVSLLVMFGGVSTALWLVGFIEKLVARANPLREKVGSAAIEMVLCTCSIFIWLASLASSHSNASINCGSQRQSMERSPSAHIHGQLDVRSTPSTSRLSLTVGSTRTKMLRIFAG